MPLDPVPPPSPTHPHLPRHPPHLGTLARLSCKLAQPAFVPALQPRGHGATGTQTTSHIVGAHTHVDDSHDSHGEHSRRPAPFPAAAVYTPATTACAPLEDRESKALYGGLIAGRGGSGAEGKLSDRGPSDARSHYRDAATADVYQSSRTSWLQEPQTPPSSALSLGDTLVLEPCVRLSRRLCLRLARGSSDKYPNKRGFQFPFPSSTAGRLVATKDEALPRKFAVFAVANKLKDALPAGRNGGGQWRRDDQEARTPHGAPPPKSDTVLDAKGDLGSPSSVFSSRFIIGRMRM
ncbi:hypothetical protein C8R46DRAFT_1230971 [Mycena filopes]|nr:hypothetical protein C8R46DRAFT_1230971 [Mycena filopes]